MSEHNNIPTRLNVPGRIWHFSNDANEMRQLLHDCRIWTLEDRIKWLTNLDHAIVRMQDEILETLAEEKHCSRHAALLSEYFPVRMLLKEYIRTARKVLGDEKRSKPLSFNFSSKRAVVRKEPLGVVGVITPSNAPMALPLAPIAAAILGGNAVLWKPPQETPRINQIIARILTETLTTHIWGAGLLFKKLEADVEHGRELIKCPKVNKIHFTGSVVAGREVVRANAEVRFTPPTLELGGSNAAIVLQDADLEQAAKVICFARFSGLNCNSIKRVFVIEAVWDSFTELLTAEIQNINDHERVHPLPGREIASYDTFLADFIKLQDISGRMLGSTCSTEPAIPLVFYIHKYNPTLTMLRDETFCPILPVVKVKDEAEAIRCANDTQFGLGATVFTRSKKRFRSIVEKLQAGGVYQNDALTEFAQPQLPFGGIKDSGWGYTHGPEGILDFVRSKPVIEERFWAPKLQLYPWTKKKMYWLRSLMNVIIKFS